MDETNKCFAMVPMTQSSEEPINSAYIDELFRRLNTSPVELFASIEFPSDSLSIKRLRKAFPREFDEGLLTDGFGSFFNPHLGVDSYPPTRNRPNRIPFLFKLDELISAERTLFAWAMHEKVGSFSGPETANPNPRQWLDESRDSRAAALKTLEEGYQLFKLADSPETARLLIQNIQNDGRLLVEQASARGR
jgi:hypothetical protein